MNRTRSDTGPGVKFCRGCSIERPRSGFAKNSRAKDGLQSRCDECRKIYFKTRVVEIPASGSKKCNKCFCDKQLMDFFKDKNTKDGYTHTCKVCRTAAASAWNIAHPDRVRRNDKNGSKNSPEKHRNNQLRIKFGINHSNYEQMLEKQRGVCSICKSDKPGGYGKHFNIDHDHVTGKIRGLLCSNCNTGLGLFQDRIEILQNAITYLIGTSDV